MKFKDVLKMIPDNNWEVQSLDEFWLPSTGIEDCQVNSIKLDSDEGRFFIMITLNLTVADLRQRSRVEEKALCYAERHGVIEYHVRKGKMIYYTSFPMEHMTYRATVNLETLKETREPLRRYFVAYKAKVGGRYQANYMA